MRIANSNRFKMAAAAIQIVILSCVFSPKSKAESLSELPTVIAGGVTSLVLAIGGTVTAVGNLAYIVDQERPTDGWRIANGTFGVLNGIAGIVYLSAHNSWPNEEDAIYIGLGHLAFCALGVGIGLWGASLPEDSSASLTLAPMIMPDARGNAAFGVGLRLVDW